MKLNGVSNIITDADVTLTDNKHIGKSLSSAIEETDRRLDKLESNIKWIYENGGIGSGSGSGGGGSTKWYIRATLGGIALDSNTTIPLSNGAGIYTLKLYTSGGSGEYNVSYTVGKNSTKTVKLNVDNGWSMDILVSLTENGVIEIIAKDGVRTREITGVSYIVIPYAFNSPILCRHDGTSYTSSDNAIGVSIAKQNGIVIKSSYIIATPLQECTYTWLQNGVVIDGASGSLDQDSGDIIYDVPDALFENYNAGLYSYQLIITLLPVGAVESITITHNIAFNLIPDGLYLRISPANSDEIIYDSSDIEDPFYFSTNVKVAINTRIYKGLSTQGLEGIIYWNVDGEDDDYDGNGNIRVRDGYTYKITTHFSKPGINKLIFRYSLNGEQGVPVEKYFYCREISTSYNWFFQTQNSNNNPQIRRYYIPTEVGDIPKVKDITGISESTLYIERKKSDDDNSIILNISGNSEDGVYNGENQLLNFGIQYNDINNISKELITCYDMSNNKAITIFQNEIQFEGRFSASPIKCNIFMHKEIEYDPENPKKYHLLSINIATCYTKDSSKYYEITAYLDGKMEGTVNVKANASPAISRVVLHNVNFSLNHFEVAGWGDNDIRRVFDIDVNWYYNSYRNRIGLPISSEETEALIRMFDTTELNTKPTYYMEHQLIHVDASMPENLAGNIDVPIMVITCNRDIVYDGDTKSIFDWMNTSYKDGEIGLNKETFNIQKLEWCPGINKELKEVKLQNESEELLGTFTLDLQGSSTMTNKGKNFTLTANPFESIATQGKTVLFSPNFISDEPSTFLPENAFTLKADDVDSSHSNNTAVGKFVNENNEWGYRNMINLIGVDELIQSHIKQCLEGFSMLLFLHVSYVESGKDYNDYYYLGIYNFNLGRDSYFNLGYSDLKQLNSQYLDESASNNNGFAVCVADRDPVDGFVAAEVQDNSQYWDFSQYDSSILFPLNTSETSDFMFGDFVSSTASASAIRPTIQNLVKNVAGAGGYLFNLIGKVPVSCDETISGSKNPRAYHDTLITHDDVNNKDIITTYVSDVTQQFVRTRDDQGLHWISHPSAEIDVTNVGNLIQCIKDDPNNNWIAPLNYPSLVYYYVTCMALGLVDSVEKNLNIKTWSATNNGIGAKSGIFFYDMDTALGKNNAGDKVAYFAFSDYWKSNIIKYDIAGNIISPEDTTTEAVKIVNNGITNFRDTFILGNDDIKGYDVPSSFLFAIAKYAYVNSDISTETFEGIFPQQIYATWRNNTGPLSSADYFIETYFASNLKDIPDFLINLNYRNKYLYDWDSTKPNFEHSTRLHGVGVEETRDWLRGRLRILDAYFNINKIDIHITDTIPEPKNTVTFNNQDINLFSDIFSNGNEGVARDQGMVFTVTAPDYSPLVARIGGSYIWYIFENSNIEYETHIPGGNGTEITILGGSQLWRTLDSINSFVSSRSVTSGSFIFNSDTIEHMIGTSGTQTGAWLVTGPSLEEISLTSSNYGGSLSLDNSFYSIKTINISNSKISVAANNCPVKDFRARNVKGYAKIELVDCKSLQNVDLTGATLQTCDIRPAWTDTLNFNNVYARDVILETKNKGTFTVSNNSTISSFKFSNFETITINKCANLTSVQCNDDLAVLKTVNITDCANLRSLILVADNLEVLNLKGCTALTEITLKGTTFNNLRILGLTNTKVSKITIGDTVYSNGVFDFTMFPKLAKADPDYPITPYVSFYNNPNVVSIQFDNSGNTYLRADPNNTSASYNSTFYNCVNLERIYGSFIIMCNYCFYRCSKFSVHGSDLTQVRWKGLSVLNNKKVKHPLDFSGVTNIDSYWPSGLNITNMKYGGNYATWTFYGTNYTLFDIYYILFGCDSSVKSLNSTFRSGGNTLYGKFNWNATVDNSPDKRMFKNCIGVTSLSLTFFGNSGEIRLFSPTTAITEDDPDDNRNVTQDDGLFSPLVSLTSYDRVFSGYTTYIDRFIWRRFSENYELTKLQGFTGSRIINSDINTINYNTAKSLSVSNHGNLTNFFKNIQSLKGEINGLLYTRCIDYDTVSDIPIDITILRRSFISTEGRGKIYLDRLFKSGSKITSIFHSFMIIGENPTQIPTMELTNDTFTSLTNLTQIGYSDSDSNFPSMGIKKPSFYGVDKSYGNEFPFDIFINHPNLTMADGIFMNAKGNVQNLKLPGRLFENNSKLEKCSTLFYNLDNGVYKYSISETHPISYKKDPNNSTKIIAEIDNTEGEPNFTKCTNLSDVSYMFWNAQGDEFPQLTGMIPKNLFWHGLSSSSKINTIRGANTRVLHEEDGRSYYEYIEEDPIEQWQIVPLTTINQMEYCFQHCDCSPYINRTPEPERNPTYSPFKYIFENNRWRENKNIDTNEYTYIWSYDGFNGFSIINETSDILNFDFVDWDAIFNEDQKVYGEQICSGGFEPNYGDVLPSSQKTFICAPDLLRFCTTDAKIIGLFAYSGTSGMSTQYSNTSLHNFGGKYAFGLKGRICPYLLNPVSDTKSVAYMFSNCKCLSYIHNYETQEDYMLPENFFKKAINVNDLTGMFQRTLQPHRITLRECFKPLIDKLTLNYIYNKCHWSGESGDPTNIVEVFRTNQLESVKGAFLMKESPEDSNKGAQFITFQNIFPSSYNSGTYAADDKFSIVFFGYSRPTTNTIYVTHEDPKTLPDNLSTRNYSYI